MNDGRMLLIASALRRVPVVLVVGGIPEVLP